MNLVELIEYLMMMDSGPDKVAEMMKFMEDTGVDPIIQKHILACVDKDSGEFHGILDNAVKNYKIVTS